MFSIILYVIDQCDLRKLFNRTTFCETAFTAKTLCSEVNVLFYRRLLIHLLFAWNCSFKGQILCLFKTPRGNLTCLCIWANIGSVESKSKTLVSLERQDKSEFGIFKETVLRDVPNTAPIHSHFPQLEIGFPQALSQTAHINTQNTDKRFFYTVSVIIQKKGSHGGEVLIHCYK